MLPTEPVDRRWSNGLPRALFALAALAAVIAIVYLGRNATFFHDEWTIIDRRGAWSLDALLEPHNEHLTLGLTLVYKAVFEIVGMRSYLPYLAVLAALHVLVAAAVVHVAARNSGWAMALPLGLLMLFLGTGWENLYWGASMGFVGATASGLWALIAQQAGRWAVASILLLVAVVTLGVGLPFVVASITLGVAARHRFRHVAAVVLPAVVAYGAWFLAIGREAASVTHDPFQLANVGNIRDYVLTGVSHAIGSVSGLGAGLGLVVAVLAAVVLIAGIANRTRWPPLMLAAIGGLLFSYALTSLVRAQFGNEHATAARYVYLAGALILTAVAAAPTMRIGARGRPALIAGGALLFAVAMTVNVTALHQGHAFFDRHARLNRAVAAAVVRYADAPGIDQERRIRNQPGPRRLRELMDRYGSVVADAYFPRLVAPVTPEELDVALWEMAGPEFTAAPTEEPTAPAAVPAPTLSHATLDRGAGGGCSAIIVTGVSPSIDVRLADGEGLAYLGDGDGELVIWVARLADVTDELDTRLLVRAGRWYHLRPPDLAEPESSWHLRLHPPEGVERLQLCLASGS